MSQLRKKMGEEAWAEYVKIKKLLQHAITPAERVTRWRQKVKLKLLEYKGGKCIVCGYNKPVPSAYVFHHRDPSKKDFGLGTGDTRSWTRLVKEVDKCDLVCTRCHVEIHDEEYSRVRERTIVEADKRIVRIKELRRSLLTKHDISVCGEESSCKFCNSKFIPKQDGQSTCSKACRSELNAKNRKCKNRPSKEELKDLISRLPWTTIGKIFSVTDNSVRKWARSYGLL